MTPKQLTLIVLALVMGILFGLALLPSGEASGAGSVATCLTAECLGAEELAGTVSEWSAIGRTSELPPALAAASAIALGLLLVLALGAITSLYKRIG